MIALILILHPWALDIITGTAVLACHLSQRQGVTSPDTVTLSSGAVNAVLFSGWGITTLLANTAALTFSALLAQALHSLARRKPRTAQFARRMTGPALTHTHLHLGDHDSHHAVGRLLHRLRRCRTNAY